MVQRKPTPEEQLLKLIEDPESGKSSASGASSKGKAGAIQPARQAFAYGGRGKRELSSNWVGGVGTRSFSMNAYSQSVVGQQAVPKKD